ncbi:MAG TPA: hypothetical protein PKI16_02905 [Candidatus Dojkabacteria bacterium]|nr:hypothetical protein [Candidatus Dojkabacteria bacterium]
MESELLFGKFKTKEEAIEWALEILTLETPFCLEILEEQVEKAKKILLTYLPDPWLGVEYKGKIFLKEKYNPFVLSPAQAVGIINK